MSVNNIMAGFRLTGIYPHDVNAIPESSMAPSDITDKENGEIVLDKMFLLFSFGQFP